MKKTFILPQLNQMVKVEENLFDYKITFTGSYKMECEGGKHGERTKIDIIRYDSNLYRAKAKILDYAKNNIFNYFITITIDSSKADINDYEGIRKKICKQFNNIKSRYDSNFKYILVAELGGKKKRLHFHGLCYLENKSAVLTHVRSGLYRNDNLFNSLGANQFKVIKSYDIFAAVYCTKYIQKDNSAVNLFSRYYFCSKGLKTSEVITYLFSQDKLIELFRYCGSTGMFISGRYCDTLYCSSSFLLEYLGVDIDFEKRCRILY